MSDKFDFDSLETIEIPVKYKGGKYVLREATGNVAAAYRSGITGGAQLNENLKLTSLQGLGETEMDLLAGCLFVEGGKLVPRSVLGAWPDRVCQPLVVELKRISGLDNEETPEDLIDQRDKLDKKIKDLQSVKNDDTTETTTDGSD